ncbi:hypothetical protein WJR50_02270 [Catalinimonas sp. 4WD22]
MKSENIFKFLSISSLLVAGVMFFAACDPQPKGPKVGEEGEEPEAYGLQEEDLPGGDDEAVAASESEYNEDSAMYPEEKVLENTNMEDGEPVALSTDVFRLEKQKLLSTLNLHKTELENHIRNLEAKPGDQEDASVLEGNIEKYRTYLGKLDKEIAQVNAAEEDDFEEVVPSAQAAIKGAGALINTRDMRIN